MDTPKSERPHAAITHDGRGRKASDNGDEQRRRWAFARDMARSEFGRNYWNEAMAAELRKAQTRKKKKGGPNQ